MSIFLRRIGSFIIDWILIFLIGIPLLFIGPSFKTEYLLYPSISMFYSYGFFLSLLWFFVAFLFKDCVFKNASIGKKLLGLKVEVVEKRKSLVFALVIRNATLILGWIELIILLANHGTRLGDIIAKTKVVNTR